jgi:hypothetical protein
MNFITTTPLPAYPSNFTLRLFLDDASFPPRRVSTAIFLKNSGKVFQVFKAPLRGAEHHQVFNTVADWIQSTTASHGCRLILEGSGWLSNKTALENEFHPVTIIPVANTPEPTTKMSKEAVLKRMAELLKQKEQIRTEMTSLMAQITA